jgi:hypothetical protein
VAHFPKPYISGWLAMIVAYETTGLELLAPRGRFHVAQPAVVGIVPVIQPQVFKQNRT